MIKIVRKYGKTVLDFTDKTFGGCEVITSGWDYYHGICFKGEKLNMGQFKTKDPQVIVSMEIRYDTTKRSIWNIEIYYP